MIGRGVGNQTERIGVDPALVLAASEPSARDLASPRTVSAAQDPEIRTLADCRSQTECLARIFAGLRRRDCTPLSENTNQREKACDLGHFCPPCVGSANRIWAPAEAGGRRCHRFRFANRWPVEKSRGRRYLTMVSKLPVASQKQDARHSLERSSS